MTIDPKQFASLCRDYAKARARARMSMRKHNKHRQRADNLRAVIDREISQAINEDEAALMEGTLAEALERAFNPTEHA